MASEWKNVLLEKQGSIAKIVINRPAKRNALNPETLGELIGAFEKIRNDETVRVVLTTGAGDVAYTGGRDLGGFLEQHRYEREHPDSLPEQGPSAWELSQVIRNFPKVTIAVVNGYCLGAGIYLVIAHDLAIASEEKAKFGLPEVFRGLASRPSGVLFRATSMKWAMEMVLTGKNWDAQRAYAAGFVNKVVPHAQLQQAALEWAEELAQLDPLCLQFAKRAALLSQDQAGYTAANEVSSLVDAQYATIRERIGSRDQPLVDFVQGRGIKADE